MKNYVKIKDIVEHILRRFRFDFWLEEGSWFDVAPETRREYQHPEIWASIGIYEPAHAGEGTKYRPLWDIYAPDKLHVDIIKGRLRYACLRLGGRYAEKYKIPTIGPDLVCNPLADTTIFVEGERTPSRKLTND